MVGPTPYNGSDPQALITIIVLGAASVVIMSMVMKLSPNLLGPIRVDLELYLVKLPNIEMEIVNCWFILEWI